MKIGVLGLQGGVEEHLLSLSSLGVEGVKVRSLSEILQCDGLILPGGESTTLKRLLKEYQLLYPLTAMISSGFPVWGTCAGMILLASHLSDRSNDGINTMSMTVQRNGFGRQKDSFLIEGVWKPTGKDIPMVFIRAPYIVEVGREVEILAMAQERIVAVRQGNMLATAFHPELTSDTTVVKFFLEMCKIASYQLAANQ